MKNVICLTPMNFELPMIGVFNFAAACAMFPHKIRNCLNKGRGRVTKYGKHEDLDSRIDHSFPHSTKCILSRTKFGNRGVYQLHVNKNVTARVVHCSSANTINVINLHLQIN